MLLHEGARFLRSSYILKLATHYARRPFKTAVGRRIPSH